MKGEEIAEILREVRERVRARYPESSAGGIALPDLMPVVYARDAALAKVAAIGTVNPRPSGPINAVVQALKRVVARALDWHVREQVEFNRGVIAAVEAMLEVLNETKQTLATVAAHAAAGREEAGAASRSIGEVSRAAAGSAARWEEWRAAYERNLAEVAVQLAAARDTANAASQLATDVATHSATWRAGWEHRLAEIEIDFLRNVGELHAAFQHRVTLLEERVRDQVKLQHSDFSAALDRAALGIQDNTERLIHAEIRVLRQRLAMTAAVAAAPVPAAAMTAISADALAHQERFRGSEDDVRKRQQFYVPLFAACGEVLDIGCGRGEFLELMRDAGVKARGIDLSPEAIGICREKGLNIEAADLFACLAAAPDESLGGVFCAHVVEHLPPERIPEMIRLVAAKLKRGGLVAIETPNPECLAIFASHFYLDPTHVRPVPAKLLTFYLQEAGMGEIRIERFAPAAETMPSLAELPAAFRDEFFGGLDYAILARKQ